jgi:hypothetical protein
VLLQAIAITCFDFSNLIHFHSQLRNKCLVTGNELVIGDCCLIRMKEFGYLGILRFKEWRIFREISKSKIHNQQLNWILIQKPFYLLSPLAA